MPVQSHSWRASGSCAPLPADVAPVIISFVCKVPVPVLVQKVGRQGCRDRLYRGSLAQAG